MKLGIVSKATTAIEPVQRKLAPVAVKVSAKSPEILLVAGIACILGGGVLACRATLKAKDDLEEGMSAAEAMKESGEEDVAIKKQHLVTGLNVAKHYAFPAALTASGIACIVISHDIQAKRLVAAIGAFDALQLSFEDYRRRVIEDQGPAADARYMNGDKIVKADIYGEDGKKSKQEVVVRDGGADPYMTRFACDTSTEWSEEHWRNIDFIQTVEHMANRKLHVNGRVFLREVCKDLGLKYRPITALAGWVLGGNGDDQVLISVDECYTEEELELAREEKRKPVPELWLRFNCDGEIWNVED